MTTRFPLSLKRAGFTVLLASACGLAGAGTAQAGDKPSVYSERHSHVDRDAARSEQRTSCVGPDGSVYHRRDTRTADEKGERASTKVAGDPAACRSADRAAGLGAVRGEDGPIHLETGDVQVGNDMRVSPADSASDPRG